MCLLFSCFLLFGGVSSSETAASHTGHNMPVPDSPQVLKEVKSPSALHFPCAWQEVVFGVVFPSGI